jgi:hypothetical protein
MAVELAATVTPTAYEVSCLPAADEFDLWTIRVELRGHGRWSVRHNAKTFGVDGMWSFGPRDDEDATAWVTEHRFDLDTALRLAQEHAPRVRVNGMTPADVLPRPATGAATPDTKETQ